MMHTLEYVCHEIFENKQGIKNQIYLVKKLKS